MTGSNQSRSAPGITVTRRMQRISPPRPPEYQLFRAGLSGGLIYGTVRAAIMLAGLPGATWARIAFAAVATLLRVASSLILALAWTVPLGVAIGLNQRLARWSQPLVQIAASIPATALFPVFLLAILKLANNMSVAAILLMLMGTQWYLLFNVLAGASAIPQNLK
jgi:NitT/TauT family transport system permease protein